jgi:hypothetical protein
MTQKDGICDRKGLWNFINRNLNDVNGGIVFNGMTEKK